MAMWLSLCSLAGIAISVVAPLFAAKSLKLAYLPTGSNASIRPHEAD